MNTMQQMLFALQYKHIYQGTVPAATIEKRRKANKVARKTRRSRRLAEA